MELRLSEKCGVMRGKKFTTRIGELALVAQPLQIVDEVQAVHSRNFIASVRFDNLTVFEASST
jgi:hypothetical protein